MADPAKLNGATTRTELVGLIVRSRVNADKSEDAWVSLVVTQAGTQRFAPIHHCNAREYGNSAWKAAETYARGVASDLGLPVRAKRDNAGPAEGAARTAKPKPVPKQQMTRAAAASPARR